MAKEKEVIKMAKMVYKDELILAEMIYKPEEKQTMFAVMDENDEIEEKLDIQLNEEAMKEMDEDVPVFVKPFSPYNGMIQNGFVKLPSLVRKYEDEKSLFNEVDEFIRKYIHLPESFYPVAATYVMFSWLFDEFETIPYLRVVGMYGTGKTRFLNVVGSLCYRPMISSGSITTAAIYRTIHDVKGTFVFDEADFQNSQLWSEIVKILNGGHTKDKPVVRMGRSYNDKFKTDVFDVFGPKILASRGKFQDKALESRCITQYLIPVEMDEVKAPIHLPKSFEREARQIRNKLLKFRFDNRYKLSVDESFVGNLKSGRMKQSSLALVSVAKIVDDQVFEKVIDFLKSYEDELETQDLTDPKIDVLECIFLMFDDDVVKKTGKIRIGDIAYKFNNNYEGDSDVNKATERRDSYDGTVLRDTFDVSARKIGSYVKKLGINTERDRNGYYIPLAKEMIKIKNLVKRYGLDDMEYTDPLEEVFVDETKKSDKNGD